MGAFGSIADCNTQPPSPFQTVWTWERGARHRQGLFATASQAKLVDVTPPGYVVDASDVSTALARDDAGLHFIAASRHGVHLTVTRLGDLVGRREADGDMTVVFGAPERGLPAILGLDPDDVCGGSTSG